MANGVEKDRRPTKEKKLKKLKDRFDAAWRATETWRKDSEVWTRFYDGEQLSKEEIQALKERNQPAVVNNRVKKQMDTLFGIQSELEFDAAVVERGFEDSVVANILKEIIKWIEDKSQFDDVENEVYEEGATRGLSWYEVKTTFSQNYTKVLARQASSLNIFEDPETKKTDKSDAKYIDVSIWMDEEDAIQLFPKSKARIKKLLANDSDSRTSGFSQQARPDQYKAMNRGMDKKGAQFSDTERNRVRVVTEYLRIPERKTFIKGGTLQEAIETTDMGSREENRLFKDAGEGAERVTEIRNKLNATTFIENAILEEKEDIRDYDPEAKFPFVMFHTFESKAEKARTKYYGFVKQMLDQQREINKRRSKMLHLLNTNQVIAEKGATDDHERLREEAAKPDGYMEVNQGARFDISRNTELSNNQFALLQESKSEIDSVGVGAELQGRSQANSGKEFSLRTQQAQRPLSKVFKNLRKARERLVRLWLEEATQNITPAQVVRITGKEEWGLVYEEQIYKRIDFERFDVRVEIVQESLNLSEETFNKLLGLAQAGYQVPFEFILQYSDIADKDKILSSLTGGPPQGQTQPAANQDAAIAQAIQSQQALPQ